MLDTATIVMFLIQTTTTLVIGLVGWSLKSTLQRIKEDTTTNELEIKETRKEIEQLKADLPFVYVLREDYIRCQQNQENKINNIENKMNNIEKKIDKLFVFKN